MKIIIVLVLLGSTAKADIYLHNPRGSNNRLDEAGRERNNANRLFDSQNNDRGGYNVGNLYYYAGSKLMIEWTNQHSCMNPKSHCEIVLQYMCSSMVRDGSTTSTIPDNPTQCTDYDCNTDLRYGMHENYDYYKNCRSRQRNTGLFTADQKLKADRARFTRQNPTGTRRGYECPEERDYYPYWHPTPWRDIAVMTNDATKCDYYLTESENVKGRWFCDIPRETLANSKNIEIPNNKDDCDAFRYPKNDVNGVKGTWKQAPSHSLEAPVCIENQFSRDNHLGNGLGGYPLNFNWTVPDLPHPSCALRIRYNVSTADYEAWDDVDASNNKGNHQNAAGLDVTKRQGFATRPEGEQRGYIFKNNPQVQLFKDAGKLKLQLAINTAQFGRTFQDRSHVFSIEKAPGYLNDKVVQNVNVRGKRGNIVQVYPAVEYDFIPNTLELMVDQYVHFQWTGSNTNPQNNDGQGRAGTDRSNVVLQRAQIYPEGSGVAYVVNEKHGHWGRSYPEMVRNTTLLDLSQEDIINLATLRNRQFGGEMSELDDAGTYYDLGPRKVTKAGVYHYLSTRNNNFSNRSQKGRIIVTVAEIKESNIGWNGGNVTLKEGSNVYIGRGAFERRVSLRLERWDREEGIERMQTDATKAPDDNFISDFYQLSPEGVLVVEGKNVDMEFRVQPGSFDDVAVYRTTSRGSTWTKIDANVDNGFAKFQTSEGGVFVAIGYTRAGVIAGAVIGALIGVALIAVATFFYSRKNPQSFSGFKRTFAGRV
ncbi:hypothetical protein CAPTEDRAFT_125179 [Capitella teleta]|uniref:Protein DD3-3 n=1 Tax=Capitella teleta TaxID=283909 RepID=R7TP97_CAPTE|nr:hypothetical protein CAPTEDRAFT_125179 [Capitella teleta]|eukprot:ELT93316.1 hypothetical protein CAPTEDRAFT_125179 [Capitella teleta]